MVFCMFLAKWNFRPAKISNIQHKNMCFCPSFQIWMTENCLRSIFLRVYNGFENPNAKMLEFVRVRSHRTESKIINILYMFFLLCYIMKDRYWNQIGVCLLGILLQTTTCYWTRLLELLKLIPTKIYLEILNRINTELIKFFVFKKKIDSKFE